MKKMLGRMVRNALTAKDEWKEVNNRDGILVHFKPIEGSNIFAFKGQTVIQASIGKICQVLDDNDGRMDWLDMIIDAIELERESDHISVFYQAFKPPFPVVKRDYVIRGELVCDPKEKTVLLEMESVDHRNAPPTVGVRAHLHHSSYQLRDLGNGSTDITVEIHTDPKGVIPTPIVNLIQRDWPYKTLKDLRQFVESQPDKEHPLVMKELYGK
ncbi:MAG: hypothetical protein HQM12_22225 [SAR324 cluster bacterium]|nr:hypothetical protein [SAR324 cluster bacterium]